MTDNLWAPWRGEYVLKEKQQGCVFCNKVAEDNDKLNYVLYRGNEIFIIMNLFPYNNGHIMLLPKRHIAEITDMTVSEMTEMGDLLTKSLHILKSAMNPQGFNVGYNIGSAAGAGIAAHLHQHIVPRWAGDCNFMPVIGAIKVISEHMDTTYKKLKERFDNLK